MSSQRGFRKLGKRFLNRVVQLANSDYVRGWLCCNCSLEGVNVKTSSSTKSSTGTKKMGARAPCQHHTTRQYSKLLSKCWPSWKLAWMSLNLGCTVSVQMFSSLAIWWLPAVSLQELQLPTRNAHPQQSSSFLAGHALEESAPWLFLTGYNRIPAMRATVSDNSLYGAAALAANPCSRISEISPHVGCWTNV